MRKFTTHSKTSLFLMEMILSLLILALACTAASRIFAAARSNRIQSEEQKQIRELCTSAGEILEGSDGQAESFLALMPGGEASGSIVSYYYDSGWELCSAAEAVYTLAVTLTPSERSKEASLAFTGRDGEPLYSLSMRYPILGFQKEVRP